MKDITLSHYTVENLEPEPWKETWDNLMAVAERMTPKLEPMDIKLRLRKVVLDDAHQDNLMMGNMVTIESPEVEVEETPIENLLMLELDYTDCDTCKTTGGVAFPCRTFVDFEGVARQTLPEEFFMEALLRVAFKANGSDGCSCCGGSSCDGCADTRDENHTHESE